MKKSGFLRFTSTFYDLDEKLRKRSSKIALVDDKFGEFLILVLKKSENISGLLKQKLFSATYFR